MSTDLRSLKSILKENDFSITKTRKLVYNAFADSDALSMKQLIHKLQKKMDKSSIYRTVDLFERLGVINRLQIGWKYKLELSEEFAGHHHHASCLECGKVIAFEESPELKLDINKIANDLSVELVSHTLELRGVCHDCNIQQLKTSNNE